MDKHVRRCFARLRTLAWIGMCVCLAVSLVYSLAGISSTQPVHASALSQPKPVYSPPIDTWKTECIDCPQSGSIETAGPLAIDDLGRLHIAYRSSIRTEITYASRFPGGWVYRQVPGVSAGQYSMALDKLGYPHFCHYDEGLSYTYWDGATWKNSSVDPNGMAGACVIAMDSQNYPHIIYFCGYPHDDSYHYIYMDEAGWHMMYLDFSGSYSLTLDGDDYAHIFNVFNGLSYRHQDSTGWSTSDIASGSFKDGALALDSNGYAHTSSYDENASALRYSYQDANGWHSGNIDDPGYPGEDTDIAVDTRGFSHISYKDDFYPNSNLKYASQDATGWHLQTVDNTDGAGVMSSIVLNQSGQPYISYINNVTGDLLLANPFVKIFLPINIKAYSSTSRLKLHLDEAAGATSFIDASGWEHNASCTTATCPTAGVAGIFGTALQFDGLNDNLTLGNPSGLNFSGNVTLEAWVRLQSTSGIQNILAHGYTSTPKREVFLRVNAGLYQVGSWDGSGYNTFTAIPAEDVGNWTYLAGVYDGAFWRLYRNGVQVSESAQPQGALLVNAPWAVGSAGNGSERFFSGRIDEVAIYPRALSANEIWMHYEALVP